jgi:hypothetical protein
MGIFGWFIRSNEMPIYTKVNGSWKNIIDMEVKNSAFNMVTKGYVKVND